LPAFDESAKVDAAAGRLAPTVHGQAFDGAPITITNDGSPKLLLFVAHWCPHCRREVPLLSQFLRTNQVPAGVKIITVSTGVNPSAPNFPPAAWLQTEQWTQPTIADDSRGTAAQAFGLPSYPYFVVLDAAGKVVTRTSGELPIEQFQSLLRRAAAPPAG
jgi:thiol-disulfide isomerase/thioredoxin